MNSETLDDLSPMLPADFFAFEVTVHPYKKMGDKLKKKHHLLNLGYQMQIFLPSEALHGYDPKVFEKLGFAFRINRSGGDPMHFPLCSDQFEIGLHPSLWSSLKIGMK